MHFPHKHLPPWGYWSPARFVNPTTTSLHPRACSVVVRHLDNLLRNLHNRLLPQEGKTSNRFQRPNPFPIKPPPKLFPICPQSSKTTPRPRSDHQDLRRMLLQHLLEESARMTREMFCHCFKGAHHHDLSSLISAIGSEINDPVGTRDHIEVAAFQPHNSNPTPLRLLLFSIKN